jgi:DNA-binding NarL/FixJ family response regulator
MPEQNGMLVARSIVEERLPTRVILLTGYDDELQMLHAAVAGVRGFCSKDISPEQLIPIVREVMAGNYVMRDEVLRPEEFRSWLEERIRNGDNYYTDDGEPYKPLSDREMEVLVCIVRGMSNKEIAAELFISQQTVKNHITSILRKCGVEDRTQAVVYALKHGWVDLQNLEV